MNNINQFNPAGTENQPAPETPESELLSPTTLKRRKIATIYLILMSVQFIPIEGMQASYIKAAAMVAAPLLMLFYSVRLNKAFPLSIFYWLLIIISVALRRASFMDISIYYSLGCLMSFSFFIALLYEDVFQLDYLIKLFRTMIYVYAVVMIMQQLGKLVGIHSSWYFNYLYLTDWKFNSLAIEPSHFTRLFGVYAFAFFELLRLKTGSKLKVQTLWKEEKWASLAVLYTLTTAGSGAGIIMLILLLSYILLRGNISLIFIVSVLLVALSPYLSQTEAVERTNKTLEATATMDIKKVKKADTSAAARVGPLIAFFENFRPEAFDFWFGQDDRFRDTPFYYANIGIVQIYGMVAYIGLLILLFACCFRGVFSVEFLFFVTAFGATVGNVAYVWAAMMVFAIIKYFYSRKDLVKENSELS